MDSDILRAVLKSCSNTENSDQSDKYEDISRETLLCSQSEATLNTLCKSLCNLLSYKISKEAYQRYSVRLLVIDILRKWCRTTSNFEHLQVFTSKENTLTFVDILLNKRLGDDTLDECYSEDALISLTEALIHLSAENPVFVPHANRLLVKLTQLEANDKVDKLFHSVLCSDLSLEVSTRERIYAAQKFKLIEEPLLNYFVNTFPDLQKDSASVDGHPGNTPDQLLEFSSRSAYVFQLMLRFLKELLVQLEYAPAVLDFTSRILKRVSAHCEGRNGDILDLYPRKLHPCVILLRIEPKHHTTQTREYMLQSMKRIFDENKDSVLILLSHFPEWLECFVNFVAQA